MAFNLSKNNDPVPAKKNNVWIVVLLALVIIGGTIRYFIPKKGAARMEAAGSTPVVDTAVATQGTGIAGTGPATDTTASAPALVADTVVAADPAPHRVAASFSKGTAAPISISDEVVDEIKKSHKITIYGYASSEGDSFVNTKLSQERAESFKQYLISKGVDAGMITAIGKGIDNPIASNDTESGRTQNRRVEVSLE